MRMRFSKKLLLLITTYILLSGAVHAEPEDDRLQSINRPIYFLNNFIDRLYLRPAMITYDTVLPYPVKAGVENFYSNIGTVLTLVSDLLQFRIKDFFNDAGRLVINSTLGIGGVFDVATPMGLKPHRTDLGQTLYAWGWKESSYFVIPLLGPSTVRDAVGLFGELWMWPPSYLEPKWRNRSYFLALLNRRYVARDLESIIGVAGVENYELVRSGYMQNRIFKLTDGKVSGQSSEELDMLGEPPE